MTSFAHTRVSIQTWGSPLLAAFARSGNHVTWQGASLLVPQMSEFNRGSSR